MRHDEHDVTHPASAWPPCRCCPAPTSPSQMNSGHVLLLCSHPRNHRSGDHPLITAPSWPGSSGSFGPAPPGAKSLRPSAPGKRSTVAIDAGAKPASGSASSRLSTHPRTPLPHNCHCSIRRYANVHVLKVRDMAGSSHQDNGATRDALIQWSKGSASAHPSVAVLRPRVLKKPGVG